MNENRVELYGDGIGYVELVDSTGANTSEEKRVAFVTGLAAIARGKKVSKSPEKTYKRFMTEAEGDRASRPMEFLPVVLHNGEIDALIQYGNRQHLTNGLVRFSYVEENTDVDETETYADMYTNARALLNIGMKYEDIPFNSVHETHQFRAFRAKIPMFAWAQAPSTHSMVSKESQSDRVTEVDQYWLPADLEERILQEVDKVDSVVPEFILKAMVNINVRIVFKQWMIHEAPQAKVQGFLKALGYKREIYGRFPYYVKYKEFVFTGWLNDDHGLKHLVREREGLPELHKSWVQGPTSEFAVGITKLLEYTGE